MTCLPLSRSEAAQRGWNEVDVVLITGDAYVDHPAFGAAVIGRVLEARGWRVGIIAMPDWRDPQSVTVFGRPRLFFGVTSGNIDSMLARYTAFKRYRSDDPYAPGGKAGRKPERAVLAYCNLIKAAYKDAPIVLGGVEASMRRIAHYDFWSNRVRRSILEDARADILVYGMGEAAIAAIAERLSAGQPLDGIPGTAHLSRALSADAVPLPPEEEVMASQAQLLECYRLFYRHQRERLAQPTGKRYLIHNPPQAMTTAELDAMYDLPFSRKPHPSYHEPIPAFEMIRHSITAHRGCVSGCSFCSLGLHQGKRIVSRSPESVRREVERMANAPDFTGHVTDIGGPSANMYGIECARAWDCGRESCLFPALCPNLRLNAGAWLNLLRQASRVNGVARVTVGSGIRYDLFMQAPDAENLLKELVAHHISGLLKIAPEHVCPAALRAMRKTPIFSLSAFVERFRAITRSLGKEQYPLPYVMSCHPGSSDAETQAMRDEIFSIFGFVPEQTQAFIPLPMTLSSVIYFTGIDPLTGERFSVTRDMDERRKQHQRLFQQAVGKSESAKQGHAAKRGRSKHLKSPRPHQGGR